MKMRVAVASGKGGTGKTTLVTNLAYSLAQHQAILVLDCDVEEPNVHLFLDTRSINQQDVTTWVPKVNNQLCNGCGLCVDRCEFNALSLINKAVMVFPELCHSCAGCQYYCQQKAITEQQRTIGHISRSKNGQLELVEGRLSLGSPLAPYVIDRVLSFGDKDSNIIIDASPGTSCSVVAAVKDADYCLMVTEPTPFGKNDLHLAIQMAQKIGVPVGVIVNRAGIGDSGVYELCQQMGVPVVLEIPFEVAIARKYARGQLFCQNKQQWQQRFRDLWQQIEELVRSD